MTDKGLTPEQAERFRQWCWPHQEAMLRLALLLTRREDQAEDIVHDAMIKAMRAIDTRCVTAMRVFTRRPETVASEAKHKEPRIRDHTF